MEKKRDSFFLSDKKQKKNEKRQQQKSFKNEKTPEKHKKNDKRQENFNKNRNGLEKDEGNDRTKKPFDKKTYRLKKYSKKYKLDQWEEQRKKKLLRNYYKEIENDPVTGSYTPKIFDEDATDGTESFGRFVKHPDLIEKENENLEKNSKKDPFSRAKEQYNKIKQEKLDKQKEVEKAKEERRLKLLEYKKKKQERFKKLSKKTKKGQPVMTGRLELLLEKIQKTT